MRHYLDKAEADIGRSPSGGGADGRPPQAVAFTCAPLQTWSPDRGSLDCVWVQWCAGHLTDDDFVAFMLRAAAGLRPGGCVVLKENNAREGFLVDKEDSSLTRSDAHFRQLLARCVSALRLERVKLQTGFPAELFAVRSCVARGVGGWVGERVWVDGGREGVWCRAVAIPTPVPALTPRAAQCTCCASASDGQGAPHATGGGRVGGGMLMRQRCSDTMTRK